MALFKKNKQEQREQEQHSAEAANNAQSSATETRGGERDLSYVLRKPRITEKATLGIEHNVYVFEIAPWANKQEVSKAVQHIYKVTPRKVNLAKIPEKQLSSRFRRRGGVKQGGKKAYIYLKEGDRIEFV
jgi:large subunit ribosomal protein L23